MSLLIAILIPRGKVHRPDRVYVSNFVGAWIKSRGATADIEDQRRLHVVWHARAVVESELQAVVYVLRVQRGGDDARRVERGNSTQELHKEKCLVSII